MKRCFFLILTLSLCLALGLSCRSVEQQKITLMFIGDIMQSLDVPEDIQNKRDNDFTFAFLKTANILKTADIAFGNLETPISKKGHKLDRGYPPDAPYFRAPPQALDGLKSAGIDIVSLANNHILDYGMEALLDTTRYLDKAKIKYAGLTKDGELYQAPLIFKIKGMRIGYLAYTDPVSKYCYSEVFRSFAIRPAEAKREIIAEDIRRLKEKADLIIISLHWGIEYTKKPNEHQRQLARFIIDQGGVIVVGHHPHYLQSVVRYKEGVIIYSLGNFVFDLYLDEESRNSAILRIQIKGAKINKISVLPVKINEFWQPVPKHKHFIDLTF